MRRFKMLAFGTLALTGLAFAGCERRAPNADQQGKDYTTSTTPAATTGTPAADRVPSDLDRQPVSGTTPSAVPSASTDTAVPATTTSDLYWVSDDGTRAVLHDSALITQVQQKLSASGQYHGATDGRTSPELASAIRDFQKKQGLTETGSIDRRTADAMGLDWSRFKTSTGSESGLGDKLNGAADKIEHKATELGHDIKSGAQKTGSELERGANKASDKIKEGVDSVDPNLRDKTNNQ